MQLATFLYILYIKSKNPKISEHYAKKSAKFSLLIVVLHEKSCSVTFLKVVSQLKDIEHEKKCDICLFN